MVSDTLISQARNIKNAGLNAYAALFSEAIINCDTLISQLI